MFNEFSQSQNQVNHKLNDAISMVCVYCYWLWDPNDAICLAIGEVVACDACIRNNTC